MTHYYNVCVVKTKAFCDRFLAQFELLLNKKKKVKNKKKT